MIKVGIIGLGAIGQRLIQSFGANENTKIVAVCDVNEVLARETSEKLGVPFYVDHKTFLQHADLELVYVGVPPKYHHEVASDVISKGIHIFCEKPLANSVEEAESLLKLAEESGVIHAMNFPLNYSPASNTFAKLIKENYIGKLRRLELKMHFPEWPRPWQKNNWVAGKEQGGYVLEVGVHFIQQIQRVFGPVSLIYKQIQFPDDPNASENGILALLELQDGTPLIIDGLSQVAGDEEIAFSAYGTEGTLSLKNWAQLEGGKLGNVIKPMEADSSLSDSLINNLVKAINGEPATIIDFHSGYEAQIVLEQLRN